MASRGSLLESAVGRPASFHFVALLVHALVYKSSIQNPTGQVPSWRTQGAPKSGHGGGRWECGGGSWRGASEQAPDSHAYRSPVRADLPLAADLELAGTGGLGLLQVLAAVGLHGQAAVGVHLAAQNLAMLHAQAAGFAAL